MRIAGSFQAFWICGLLKDSHSLRKRHRNRSLFTTLSYLFLAFLEEVKNPEAFGGTGAVRSVTIHGRHGGRPSSIKAEACFGVSDPMGMKDITQRRGGSARSRVQSLATRRRLDAKRDLKSGGQAASPVGFPAGRRKLPAGRRRSPEPEGPATSRAILTSKQAPRGGSYPGSAGRRRLRR